MPGLCLKNSGHLFKLVILSPPPISTSNLLYPRILPESGLLPQTPNPCLGLSLIISFQNSCSGLLPGLPASISCSLESRPLHWPPLNNVGSHHPHPLNPVLTPVCLPEEGGLFPWYSRSFLIKPLLWPQLCPPHAPLLICLLFLESPVPPAFCLCLLPVSPPQISPLLPLPAAGVSHPL